MEYSRQWIVTTLRRLGYEEEADAAARDLPEDVELEQLEKFGDEHGLSRGVLIDRMGGSP
jgi:hypothetical protein